MTALLSSLNGYSRCWKVYWLFLLLHCLHFKWWTMAFTTFQVYERFLILFVPLGFSWSPLRKTKEPNHEKKAQRKKNMYMLRQSWQKRNLISPPPTKKGLFLGEGDCFGIFSWFFGFGAQNNLGKTLGQSRCFGMIISQFRPFYDFVKFKKSGVFSLLEKIWQLFFFQITILSQIGPRTIKNGFSWHSLGSKDDLYRFLIHFWLFKILSFYAFFMLKSVVFSSFDAVW